MIDPPKLDWKGITLQALRTPLQDWRLLLRCAAMPSLLYLVLVIGCRYTFPDAFNYSPPGEDGSLLWRLLELVPLLFFEWRWMSALWHGDARGGNRSDTPPLWVRYIVLFAAFEILQVAIGLLPALVYQQTGDFLKVQDMENVAASAFQWIDVIVTTTKLWVLVRLLVWNAAIIDRRKIMGPIPIWHLTRGHAWRIFCVVFLLALPLLVADELTSWLSIGRGAGEIPYLDIFRSLPLSIYSYAAYGAASLLIFRRLTQHETDRSLDVF